MTRRLRLWIWLGVAHRGRDRVVVRAAVRRDRLRASPRRRRARRARRARSRRGARARAAELARPRCSVRADQPGRALARGIAVSIGRAVAVVLRARAWSPRCTGCGRRHAIGGSGSRHTRSMPIASARARRGVRSLDRGRRRDAATRLVVAASLDVARRRAADRRARRSPGSCGSTASRPCSCTTR